jgi:hypothetical protein
MFHKHKIEKSERKKFMPFVNERNFMGTLLNDHNKAYCDSSDLTNSKNMAMI